MDDRQKYIGASEAAAVLGLSRWATPLEIWALKTGQIQAKDISEKIEVKLGNKLEQTVAELFMEETGKKVHRVNETLYHADYPFIGANLDRRVVGENAVLECKTATAFKYKEWEGQDIPQEYLIQVLHQMAVGKFDKGYIACLIGNHKFVWKEIAYDKKLISDMIKKEVHFWNTFVKPVVMPSQVSANDSEVLFQLYHEVEPGSKIELGDDADKIIESLDSLKADARVLEKEIDQQENTLKAMLKDSEIGTTNNHKITWKIQVSRRLSADQLKQDLPEVYFKYSKPSESRVLRISELKEIK